MLSVTRLTRLTNLRNIMGIHTISTVESRYLRPKQLTAKPVKCSCNIQHPVQPVQPVPVQPVPVQPYNSYEAPSLTSGVIKSVEEGVIFSVKMIGGMIAMFAYIGIGLAIFFYFAV